MVLRNARFCSAFFAAFALFFIFLLMLSGKDEESEELFHEDPFIVTEAKVESAPPWKPCIDSSKGPAFTVFYRIGLIQADLRSTIRQTWASSLSSHNGRLVFVVEKDPPESYAPSRDILEASLQGLRSEAALLSDVAGVSGSGLGAVVELENRRRKACPLEASWSVVVSGGAAVSPERLAAFLKTGPRNELHCAFRTSASCHLTGLLFPPSGKGELMRQALRHRVRQDRHETLYLVFDDRVIV